MDTKHLPESIVDDRGTLACRETGLPAARRQLAHVEPEQLASLDRICIEGLEVFANHGVFPEEKECSWAEVRGERDILYRYAACRCGR